MFKLIKFTLVIIIFGLLSACAPAVFVAGTAAGTAIAFDNRKLDIIASDHSITHKIHLQIAKDSAFNRSHVEISTFNHIVLITGQVSNQQLKFKVEKIARNMPKVKRVFNKIEIAKRAPIQQKTKDTWITTKVKSQLLTSQGLISSQIKVITENNTVYLMGLVTHKQAQIASDVARRVTQVERIVSVFEFVRPT